MQNDIKDYMKTVSRNFEAMEQCAPQIEAAVNACIACIGSQRKVVWCGNGGSAADAQHMAAELMGRYKEERAALPSIALTVDTSALTAISNDYGFDHVFSRQLQGIGHAGDLLIAISTSGNSGNITTVLECAKSMGITTIGLTGAGGGKMKDMCDIWIGVPSNDTNHIQEMHLAVEHYICGAVEQKFKVTGRP